MQISVHFTGELGRTLRATARLRRGRIRVGYGVGALLVLVAVIGGAGGAPAFDAVFVGACGALMIAMPWSLLWLAVWRVREAIVVDIDMEVTDQGISRRTATSQVQARWEMIRKVIETRGYWIFVIDPLHVVTLYKSVLTPGQHAELAAFLARQPWRAAHDQP